MFGEGTKSVKVSSSSLSFPGIGYKAAPRVKANSTEVMGSINAKKMPGQNLMKL